MARVRGDEGRGRGGEVVPARRPAASAVLAIAAVAAVAGCSRGGEGPSGLGTAVAKGLPKALVASADGAWLAWLDGCVEVKGRFLPPGTASCDAWAAPSDGHAPPLKVGQAVTSLPQGLTAAPAGDGLAVLADYEVESGLGTLRLVRGGLPREVARGVSFHGFAPGSPVLVAIAADGLVVVERDGAVRPTALRNLTSFALATGPEGQVTGVGRGPATRGGLLQPLGAGVREGAMPLDSAVLEYALSADGRTTAWTRTTPAGPELHVRGPAWGAGALAVGVRAFLFAPDAAALAYVSEAAPGRQGDLHLAAPGPGAAEAGRFDLKGDATFRGVRRERLAGEVGEHRWAARAPRLAWLEKYDPRVRSGVLGTGGPGLPTRTFGAAVTDFELSADGARLAFLRHTTAGGYSVDLEVVETAGEGAPRPVARGVFGFAFSPDGAWLYYRTRCTRNAEACDLERVPAAWTGTGGAAGAGAGAGTGPAGPKPELVAAGVKSFEFDPRDPSRLLLGWQRADLVALDVGTWQGGAPVRVDQGALPGSVRFLGPDSRRLAYAVVQPKRAGVYVATLPAPGAKPAP